METSQHPQRKRPVELVPGEYNLPVIGGLLEDISGAAQGEGENIAHAVNKSEAKVAKEIPGVSAVKKGVEGAGSAVKSVTELLTHDSLVRLVELVAGIALLIFGLVQIGNGARSAVGV